MISNEEIAKKLQMQLNLSTLEGEQNASAVTEKPIIPVPNIESSS